MNKDLLTDKGAKDSKISDRGVIRASERVIRARGETVRAGQDFWRHSLTNFKIQKYYQNEPEFYGLYSRNNWSKIKDRAYVINLDEYKSIWTRLYEDINNFGASNDVKYFDNFEVEHIPKEIKKFIGKKNITTNIFRIQVCDSVMCQYFCIEFFGFMLKGKILLDYINLSSPNE